VRGLTGLRLGAGILHPLTEPVVRKVKTPPHRLLASAGVPRAFCLMLESKNLVHCALIDFDLTVFSYLRDSINHPTAR
jgi:hypothetical protein